MNTNSFIAVLKNKPFEMGLWSEVKQQPYFNICCSQIVQDLGLV